MVKKEAGRDKDFEEFCSKFVESSLDLFQKSGKFEFTIRPYKDEWGIIVYDGNIVYDSKYNSSQTFRHREDALRSCYEIYKGSDEYIHKYSAWQAMQRRNEYIKSRIYLSPPTVLTIINHWKAGDLDSVMKVIQSYIQNKFKYSKPVLSKDIVTKLISEDTQNTKDRVELYIYSALVKGKLPSDSDMRVSKQIKERLNVS